MGKRGKMSFNRMKKSFGVIIFLILGLSLIGFISGSLLVTGLNESSETQVLGVTDDVPSIKPITKQQFDLQVLYRLINAYRIENKLTKLKIQPALELSAKNKVADMIEHNYFGHEDKKNTPSWYLLHQAGYEYSIAGENLSSGHETPWQVFEAWLESDQHREQLLIEGYADMGAGVECEKQSCIIVLHLGSR